MHSSPRRPGASSAPYWSATNTLVFAIGRPIGTGPVTSPLISAAVDQIVVSVGPYTFSKRHPVASRSAASVAVIGSPPHSTVRPRRPPPALAGAAGRPKGGGARHTRPAHHRRPADAERQEELEAGDVESRRRRPQNRVSGPQAKTLGEVRDHVGQVAMRDDDATRLPGGPRGVDDVRGGIQGDPRLL